MWRGVSGRTGVRLWLLAVGCWLPDADAAGTVAGEAPLTLASGAAEPGCGGVVPMAEPSAALVAGEAPLALASGAAGLGC